MQGFIIGFIGTDSNNVAKVEDLLHGIHMVNQYKWTPLIAEGDSKVVLHMERKIHHGNSSTKVASSWRLEGRLENLVEFMHPRLALSFNHVKRNGNKLAANLGTETH